MKIEVLTIESIQLCKFDNYADAINVFPFLKYYSKYYEIESFNKILFIERNINYAVQGYACNSTVMADLIYLYKAFPDSNFWFVYVNNYPGIDMTCLIHVVR